MQGRARIVALALVLATTIGAAFIYEVARVRPELTDPVTSPLPSHPQEVQRLEEGFVWAMNRAGVPIFELESRSMYRLESGEQIVHDIERLAIHLEDGRVVEIRSDRGLMQQTGRDRDDMTVELEGLVKVRDPDGVELETERLVYDAVRRVLHCIGTTYITGEGFRARTESLLYRPEGRVIEGLDGVRFWLGEDDPWNVDAEHATYRIELRQISFDRPFRARRAGVEMLSGPSTYHLPNATEPGRFEATRGALIAMPDGTSQVQLVSSGLTVVSSDQRGAVVETLETGSPSSVVYRNVDVGPTGEPIDETLAIASAGWRLVPGEQDGAWIARAGPSFTLHGVSTAGELTAEGTWLELTRAASGVVTEVNGEGAVVVRVPDALVADGDRLVWNVASPDVVVITGAPARARNGADLIEAPTLRLIGDQELLLAEGPVHAELHDVGDGSALFREREPVRIQSASARIPAKTGEIVFSGAVHAYQGISSLRAMTLRFDRTAQVLRAEHEVGLRMERLSGLQKIIVRMTSDELEYDAAARMATFRGSVEYQEYPGANLKSEVLIIRFGEQDEIESLVATDDVELEHEQIRGFADRLEWTGGMAGRIVLIGESDVARLESIEPGEMSSMKAGRIAYDMATGTAEIESVPGRRGRIESSPKPPRSDPGARENESPR